MKTPEKVEFINILLKFRNEIRIRTKVGTYCELLSLIESEIDNLENNKLSPETNN